jgi:hypothetical protein
MEWLEANPLPTECQNCEEEDCYNCDHAGKRWYLSAVDELRVRRKGLVKAVERLQRQIDDIDEKLAQLEEVEEENILMTQEIWEHCLSVCVQDGNVEQFNKLWDEYPEFAERMMQEFDDVVLQADTHVTEEEKLASWERMKARLRAEFGEDFI